MIVSTIAVFVSLRAGSVDALRAGPVPRGPGGGAPHRPLGIGAASCAPLPGVLQDGPSRPWGGPVDIGVLLGAPPDLADGDRERIDRASSTGRTVTRTRVGGFWPGAGDRSRDPRTGHTASPGRPRPRATAYATCSSS